MFGKDILGGTMKGEYQMATVKKAVAKKAAEVKEAVEKKTATVKEVAAKEIAVEKKATEKEVAGAAKEVAKEVTAKSAEKKEPVKKVVSTAKKAVSKKVTKKVEVKTNVVIEFAPDRKYTQANLEKIAKDVWRYDLKKKVSDIKSMDLYVNAYESKVYYVINGDITGSFDV